MNVALLKAKIVENGMTIEQFCCSIGMSTTSFWRKLSGKSEFDRTEMSSIAQGLHLTHAEMGRIFFPELVA